MGASLEIFKESEKIILILSCQTHPCPLWERETRTLFLAEQSEKNSSVGNKPEVVNLPLHLFLILGTAAGPVNYFAVEGYLLLEFSSITDLTPLDASSTP